MCKAPTETPKQRYVKAGFPPYFAEDFLSSHWQVTQRCNFHCPYCVNKELRTAGIHMPPEIMHAALLHIAGTPRRRYRFSLSGGETTLWPHLEEMLDAIRTLYTPRTAVNMLTNGSASASRMRALLKDFSQLACRFIITVHFGQTRIETLVEKLLTFTPEERKLHFHVKLLLPPADARGATARAFLDAAGITNYAVQPVLDFTTGLLAKGYTEAEFADFNPPVGQRSHFHFEHVREDGDSKDVSFLDGLRQDLFHYTGMRCAAGHSSIYIDELGRVSRGQFCGRMPYTVLERNPFEDPTFNGCVCTESFCTCIPFTALPKWRDAVNAPAWAHNEVPA